MNSAKHFLLFAIFFVLCLLAGGEARAASYLYAINDSTAGNQIYGFSVDETTGALTALANFPVATGFNGGGSTNFEMLAIDKTNKRLYTVNRGANNISAYAIDDATGALTALPFSPIAGIANERLVKVHPSGSPLIVGGDDVASYVITATAGATFTRDENYFYTGGNLGNFFGGFAVDAASGVLTALTGLTSFAPDGEVHPNGNFLMLADRTGNRVGVYQIANSGAATTLTAVTGSPFATGGTSSIAVAFNQDGTYLFIGNGTSRNFTAFSVNGTTGELSNPAVQPANTMGTTGTINGIGYVNFAPVNRAELDFDGDGKTDYDVIRTVSGRYNWYSLRGSGIHYEQFGLNPGSAAYDRFVPADYDGDGKCDIAVWRPGAQAYFYVIQSQTATFAAIPWGTTGDHALETQDFDGDGKADPTVVRGFGGTGGEYWYILQSTGGYRAQQFGDANQDGPIRGDFDGDGKADIAVYRRNTGNPANTFLILRSSDNQIQGQTFGLFNRDWIIPADFDGDGKTDFAVWRGVSAFSDGYWYWLNSSDGSLHAVSYGQPASDVPAPGDYDGDGKTDQAVVRPGVPFGSQSYFYVNRSAGGGSLTVPWGVGGDAVLAFDLQAR